MNNTQKNSMISGYAGLPLGDLSQCEVGSVGVVGVPSEVDGGPRLGTSMAPDALRKMTQQLGVYLPVEGIDLGNLNVSGDWSGALVELVAQMVDHDIKPIVIGGASDVTTAVLQAVPDLPVVAATPQAQSDVAARAENTTWVGLNGGQAADVWDQITKRKMNWRTARQLDEEQVEMLTVPDHAVLWIDMSVIDLGHAAGTVGLNPAGMKPETLVSVIASMTCNWQAIVITGLAPARDTRGMSELAAIETLNAALCNE